MADHPELEPSRSRDALLAWNAEDSASSGAEQWAVISSLMHDEALLKSQAEHLSEEAKKMDEVGDDEAKAAAGQMQRQAESMTVMAREVSQTIQEIQADPNKKGIRRKRDALLVKSGVMLETAEQEEVLSAGTHEHSVAHKHELRVHNQAEPKHEIAKTPAPKAKKSSKPKVEAPHISTEKHHAPEKKPATHGWQAAREKAEDAYEFVVEKTVAVSAFAVTAVKKVGNVCYAGVNAMLHPIDTAKKVMGHAKNVAGKVTDGAKRMMHRMSSAVMSLWPFGDDDHEEEPPLAAAPAKKPLNKQAMHAAKKVSVPFGVFLSGKYEDGESVAPGHSIFGKGLPGLPSLS